MSRRRTIFLALLAGLVAAGALGLAVAAPGSSGAAGGKPVKTVLVTLLDFEIRLSARRVPLGLVRFVVVNRGAAPHDFAVAGRKTRILAHGERATLLVRFRKAGAYPFSCTLPGHARLGMKGTLAAGTARVPAPRPGPPPPPPAPAPSAAVSLTQIGSFERPVHVTSPPGDPSRLFVVEQQGVVRLLVDGELRPQPFLDISKQVKLANETGLLSLAFAPDYAESGRFYVYFNDRNGNGNVNVAEYRRLAANPDLADEGSARTVLQVVKPYENHNGGMMQFGPDGYLYIAVGDGDSGVVYKPGAFAQTRGDLLGNVLRIDPREAGVQPYTVPATNPFVGEEGVRPEIWVYGLRNPWRFWIDPPTGDLWIADVGLGTREEIDYVPGGSGGGQNFGWPCFEGTVPFDTAETCADAVSPLLDVAHGPDSCSIIGGVVARDPRLPALDGRYLFSDLCGGRIDSLRVEGGRAVEEKELGVRVSQPTSFGVDAAGRIYVTSLEGPVYRLDPAGP